MVVGSKLIESRIWLTRFHAVTKPITRDRVCTAENLEPVRSAKIDERSRRVMAVIIHSLEGVGTKRRASNALDAIAGQRGLRNNPPLMETEMSSITYALREWYRFFLYIRFPPLVIPRRREFRLGRRNSDCSEGKGGMIEEESLVGLDHLFFSFFSRMERAFEIFAQIRDGGQAR